MISPRERARVSSVTLPARPHLSPLGDTRTALSPQLHARSAREGKGIEAGPEDAPLHQRARTGMDTGGEQ